MYGVYLFLCNNNSVLGAINYEEWMVEQYPNGIVRLPHPKTFERLEANFRDFGSFKKFGQLSLRVG